MSPLGLDPERRGARAECRGWCGGETLGAAYVTPLQGTIILYSEVPWRRTQVTPATQKRW